MKNTSIAILLAALFYVPVGMAEEVERIPLDVFPERQEPLNGKTILYEFTDGWGFYLKFENNTLSYQWRRSLQDPDNKDLGFKAGNIPYRARQIGQNLYQLYWHEKELHDTISMIIDLDSMRIYASGIMNYDKDADEIHEVFYTGVINQLIEE